MTKNLLRSGHKFKPLDRKGGYFSIQIKPFVPPGTPSKRPYTVFKGTGFLNRSSRTLEAPCLLRLLLRTLQLRSQDVAPLQLEAAGGQHLSFVVCCLLAFPNFVGCCRSRSLFSCCCCCCCCFRRRRRCSPAGGA